MVGGFPRLRLAVGLVLLVVVAGAAAAGLARLRGPQDPGQAVYVAEGIVVRDLATGTEERVAGWPRGAEDPVADLVHRRLAYAHGGRAWVVDLDGGGREGLAEGRPVAWTPDGDLVVERDGHLYAAGGRISSPDDRVDGEVVWLRRDTYASRFSGDLAVVGLRADGATTQTVVEDAWPLAASHDGRELLYAGPGGLAVLDVEAGSSEAVEPGEFRGARLSPAGPLAVWGAEALWVLSPLEGELRLLARGEVTAAAWSAEGSHVLFVAGDELRSIAADGDGLQTLRRGVRPGFLAVI